ncbi:hypothetical protein J4218_04790 [Candidatus Pacearchaeota archaeon]|nr:hypothetical protein [Candidatus Pacearchaeota archaeon]
MAKKKSSYDEELQALDIERRRALSDCDYAAYSVLCDLCGIIDDESAYERGLADRREVIPFEELQEDVGGLEEVVEEGGEKTPLKRPRKKRQIKPELVPKYIELYETAKRQGLDPDNVFEQTYQKRLLYSAVMYNKLIAGDGERVEIEDAKQTRIGNAFKDAYYRGKRLLEERTEGR